MKTNGDYLTDREWLRSVVAGKELILRGESALLYLQLYSGCIDESEVNVYMKPTTEQVHSNIICKIVKTFDEIEYFSDNNTLCTTINQTINDLLQDFDNIDSQPLVEALSDFYFSNGESFKDLVIKPHNQERFENIKKWAVNYYAV